MFYLAALIFAIIRWAPAAAPEAARALQEMADLENQIEQAQRRQAEEQRRLLEASKSLQSVDTNLQRKDQLNREGGQFLKDYEARARAGLEEIDRQQAADNAAIKASRSALGLTGARLLAESGSPAENGTPAKGGRPASSDAALLAMGLLHDMHRGRARIASQRILDLEARRGELALKRDRAQESAAYQTVFSSYSLEQLRARHRELSSQVAEAQEAADLQLAEVRELAGRHEELKNLMAKLAAQEAARAAQATPTPAPTPKPVIANAHPALPGSLPDQAEAPPEGGTPEPQSAIRNPQSAIPPSLAPRPTPLAPEVPYEDGSQPMASAMPATGDQDGTAASGTRFLFWRAQPVGVRALAGGKVLFSGAFAGYRHLLIVDHGDGWRSLYGNLIQCQLGPGDPVQPGQPVGSYQANQGSRAEPLWFEVRQGTQAVTPETWPALPAQWQARILAQVEQ